MEIDQHGNIKLDDFTITSKTSITELPTYFVDAKTVIAQVLDKQKAIQFSAAKVQENGKTVDLSLRFEEDILVSVFITIQEFDNQHKSADDFYNSLAERKSRYKKWLKNHVSFNLKDFTAGSVGVAEDKSSNVFIFLHNKNNKWANPG